MSGQPSAAGRILRDPLLHFLVLGALVFAVGWLWPSAEPDTDTRIVITPDRLDQLRLAWQAQNARPPTAEELDTLKQDFIREEMLYREAKRLGLDEDDTIVRRRLAQKAAFLFTDLSNAQAPDEAALKAFFEADREAYAVAPHYTFAHIYFNPERHGDGTQGLVEAARAALARDGSGWQALGDPFMLARAYADRTEEDIGHLFGPAFAARLATLEPGRWTGPIRSSLGVHLVRLADRTAARPAAFEEVRGRVLTDYQEAARAKAQDAFLNALADRYTVVIKDPAP